MPKRKHGDLPRKRNPMARELADDLFHQRIKAPRREYERRPRTGKWEDDDVDEVPAGVGDADGWETNDDPDPEYWDLTYWGA
jgi:hypothetical protein